MKFGIFIIFQIFIVTTIVCELHIGYDIVDILDQNCLTFKEYFKDDYFSLKNSPFKPNEFVLQIYLYKNNEIVKFNLSDGISILNSPYFDKNLPVTIFTHGFHTDMNGDDVNVIIPALLEKGGTNIMAVDTKDFLSWDYLKASTNTIFIGEYLGNLLVQLNKGGICSENIHLIGFSLGAHISGIASKVFTKTTTLKIGRLSGLDVARPCFLDNHSTDYKLTKDDANFVDIMHTNGGVLGFAEPIGHVDFYPNGGSDQPNTFIIGQSHHRAWDLYAYTIRHPRGFPAVPCKDYDTFLKGNCSLNPYVYMGYETPCNSKGVYYLKTSGFQPYYLGSKGIEK